MVEYRSEGVRKCEPYGYEGVGQEWSILVIANNLFSDQKWVLYLMFLRKVGKDEIREKHLRSQGNQWGRRGI